MGCRKLSAGTFLLRMHAALTIAILCAGFVRNALGCDSTQTINNEFTSSQSTQLYCSTKFVGTKKICLDITASPQPSKTYEVNWKVIGGGATLQQGSHKGSTKWTQKVVMSFHTKLKTVELALEVTVPPKDKMTIHYSATSCTEDNEFQMEPAITR